MNKLVAWFVKVTGFLPQLIFFKKKIYYQNKKVQGRKIKGGAIVASNHNSLLDFALLMFVFMQRDMYTLVAEVMFQKNVFLTWLLKRVGCIRVDRYKADTNSLNIAIKKLRKGKVVEIFPEGRLPLKHEQGLLPFKTGAVHLALKSNTPIIPVYLDGKYGKKQNAGVMIGEPIDVCKMYNPLKTEKENVDELTEYLKNAIKALGEKLNEAKEKK